MSRKKAFKEGLISLFIDIYNLCGLFNSKMNFREEQQW